jgi:N-formylglutamate amidohydrolase
MSALKKYTLEEIRQRLGEHCFPFSGITELGSAEFRLLKPACHAGVVLHAGSRIDPVLKENLLISEADQFREEDPYMQEFIRDFPLQIIARDSRFEYDLNRDPGDAVYPYGQPKFGMDMWKRKLREEELRPGMDKHSEFYELMDMVVRYMLGRNRVALVFDMHSYCFQREEKIDWFRDPRPEINLGSKAVNRERFGKLIDFFLEKLSGQSIGEHPVRVAENAIFPGGYLSRRLSRKWPDEVLVLALEYKKIFMDEWSGEIFSPILDKLLARFNRAASELVRSAREKN